MDTCNIISCVIAVIAVILSILVLIKINKNSSKSPSMKTKITPIILGSGGVWKNGSQSDCSAKMQDAEQDSYNTMFYCDGNMLDYTSNDVCPAGAPMAITSSQCANPVVSAGNSGSNQFLCCLSQNSSDCAPYPVDTQCFPGLKCQPAPDSYGLPSVIGQCALPAN